MSLVHPRGLIENSIKKNFGTQHDKTPSVHQVCSASISDTTLFAPELLPCQSSLPFQPPSAEMHEVHVPHANCAIHHVRLERFSSMALNGVAANPILKYLQWYWMGHWILISCTQTQSFAGSSFLVAFGFSTWLGYCAWGLFCKCSKASVFSYQPAPRARKLSLFNDHILRFNHFFFLCYRTMPGKGQATNAFWNDGFECSANCFQILTQQGEVSQCLDGSACLV